MMPQPRRGIFVRVTLAALGCGLAAYALSHVNAPARPASPPSPGYTLFSPLRLTKTYLVDLSGQLVHSWPSAYEPGEAAYLLDDGSLLRTGRDPGNRHFFGGGIGGRVERIGVDGKLLWEFAYAGEKRCQHHDIKPLPNGHVLLIAWEKKTRAQALAAGLDPERMTGPEIWPDTLIEVEPQGPLSGKIVWEWHVWDHLVQDFDPNKPDFGEVAEHPELVDLNYRRTKSRETPAEISRLRSLGYVGGGTGGDNAPDPQSRPGPGGNDQAADWCHTNSVDYNPELDQIMISVYTFNELWIIDHSTTTQEAAGHKGGRYGQGGDLLYRCGNPMAYLAGEPEDQMLFAQHDARWIPGDMPGGGHVTVFNNGDGRPDGQYSSVVELVLPVDSTGRYQRTRGGAFAPPTTHWEYTAPNKADFFASHLSGAERLANGNTLICSGEDARLFEVDSAGKTVWEYVNPYTEPLAQVPQPGPHGAGDTRAQPGQRPPHSRPAPPFTGKGSPDPLSGPVGAGKTHAQPTKRPLHPPPSPPGGPPVVSGSPGNAGGGLFRATRYAPDHPGILRLLEAGRALNEGGS